MDFFSISSKKGKIKGHFEGITKKEKMRASHTHGICAMGYAVFEQDERIPDNDFFVPGKVLEIRARHSNSPSEYTNIIT